MSLIKRWRKLYSRLLKDSDRKSIILRNKNTVIEKYYLRHLSVFTTFSHFCNFYYYQVIWRTSPVTWRHWGRPFSQQYRGSWTGSTRSAWPQPTRPLSSARWTSSIIFIEKFVNRTATLVLKKDTDGQLCSLQVFNLGLQLKTEELYKGIVRRDSIWDKLLFWFVRQKVGLK